MTTSDPRIVIIGGAIMGCFTAWSLRQQGFAGPITVVEKDPTYQFSSTALSAASIRTQFGTPLNIHMSRYAIDFFRSIKTHFGADADIGYTEKGYLILGTPESLSARCAEVDMQRAEGADVVLLEPKELARRFPFLSTDGIGLGTLGLSGEGWFDAWSLLSLVRNAARGMDVTFMTDSVEALNLAHDRVRSVQLVGGGLIECDICVMAAGPTSGALSARAGLDLPVIPRKRTVFSFRAPLQADNFPMLFDTSGFWIRPEGEGYIGGIQPPADQDPDATGDYEPHHDMMEEVYWPALAARIPAMEQLRLDRAWAGHYEINTLDHNGIVGPHDAVDNLIFCTGFSGHGVMHAPAAGRAVAEWIQHGHYQTLDLTPLGYPRIRAEAPLVESTVY